MRSGRQRDRAADLDPRPGSPRPVDRRADVQPAVDQHAAGARFLEAGHRTTAEVVTLALMSNVVRAGAGGRPPSLVMAMIEIWYPAPAGSRRLMAVSPVDPDASIAPFRMNPMGPVME